MNNLQKLSKTLPVLGFFVAAILVFSACSPQINGVPAIKIKNYIKWKIAFREHTPDSIKMQAFLAIEKYILDDSHPKQFLIRDTRIRIIPDENSAVMSIDLIGIAATSAVPTKRPKGPVGPHIDIHPVTIPTTDYFSTSIISISPLKGNYNHETFIEKESMIK